MVFITMAAMNQFWPKSSADLANESVPGLPHCANRQ